MKEFFKCKRVKWSLIGLGGIIVIVVGLWCLQYLQNKHHLDKYYPDLPCDGIFSLDVPYSIAKLHCKSHCWLDGVKTNTRGKYTCYSEKQIKKQQEELKQEIQECLEKFEQESCYYIHYE